MFRFAGVWDFGFPASGAKAHWLGIQVTQISAVVVVNHVAWRTNAWSVPGYLPYLSPPLARR